MAAQQVLGGYNDINTPQRPPAQSIGSESNWYIDFLSGNVFGPKTSGQWPQSPTANTIPQIITGDHTFTGANTHSGPETFTNPQTTIPALGGAVFAASNPTYGSCVWGPTGDAGPCVNAAIATAASAGGGCVLLPASGASSFGLKTEIVNNTSGVNFCAQSFGITVSAQNPLVFEAATTFIWTGAAHATMFYDGPVSSSANELFTTNVFGGVLFDCNNTADICAKIITNGSELNVAANRPLKYGIIHTALHIGSGNGSQWNTGHLWARCDPTGTAYPQTPVAQPPSNSTPTLILIDSGLASGNSSFDHFTSLQVQRQCPGDGIVLGNEDNIQIDDAYDYSQPGINGRSIVFANSNYTMANGDTLVNGVNGNNATVIRHISSPSGLFVLGFNTGSTIVPANTNSCNGGGPTACGSATITLNTNAQTNYLSDILAFVSPSAVVLGEQINCGTGTSSGVIPNTVVTQVGSNFVRMRDQAAGNNVASGTSCVFSFGVMPPAVNGTYTITATGASTFNIASPFGAPSQTGVSASAGVVPFQVLTWPFMGMATAGDTWTLTVPQPSRGALLDGIDASNLNPNPAVETGALANFRFTDYENFLSRGYGASLSSIGATFQPFGTDQNASGLQYIMGNNTRGIGTTTPNNIDLGGDFSTVAGQNPKLVLYDDGTSQYGVGISDQSIPSMDFIIPSAISAIYNFYVGATSVASLSPSFFSIKGSSTAASFQSTGAAPTLTTGSCSGSGWVGGSTAGRFTAGTCSGGTYTLTGLPASNNGYDCSAQDITTTADTLKQAGSLSPTSCTFLATTVSGDVISVKAMGY